MKYQFIKFLITVLFESMSDSELESFIRQYSTRIYNYSLSENSIISSNLFIEYYEMVMYDATSFPENIFIDSTVHRSVLDITNVDLTQQSVNIVNIGKLVLPEIIAKLPHDVLVISINAICQYIESALPNNDIFIDIRLKLLHILTLKK